MRARLAQGLRGLLSSEQGIALPVAMLTTVVALGFAAVPIMASIDTQSGDSHDEAGNRALAAAETGANLAVSRQSQMASLVTPTEPCVAEAGGKLEKKAPTSGWCAKVALTTSPAPPAGTKASYLVMPCYHQSGASSSCAQQISCETPTKLLPESEENLIKVIATGEAQVGGRWVSRRVAVTACSKQQTTKKTTKKTIPPPNVFATGQIVGIDSLVMSNNAQVYHGGAGSNGSVYLTGNANVCGPVHYGTTIKADNNSDQQPFNCAEGRTFVKGTSEYPAVALPADIETNNSNGRLVSNGNTVQWNASNRSLSVGNNGSLTLDGTAPYFLCSLEVTGNASLLAAPGAKIRIFFDEPSKCSGLNGAPQLRLWNNAKVLPDSGTGPDFYFLGSATNPNSSDIELQGNGQAWTFVIYAPNSKVNAANNFSLNGIVVGRTLEFAGNASVNQARAFSGPSPEEFLPTTEETTEVVTTTPKAYARQSYVQCSAVASSPNLPESGC